MAPSHRPASQHGRLVSEIARLNRTVDAREKQCALQQALIDASSDHLWVKDKDGAFVVVNKALASDRGRTVDALHHKRDQARQFLSDLPNPAYHGS